MELQRNRTTLDFWEMAADLTATQEEHAEMIVPDHCPDMERILNAESVVLLKNSEVRDGKAALSGTVQLSVLYIPEKSESVQSLSFVLPFQMAEDCPPDCTQLQATVTAEDVTARMLNPRKLRLQVRLSANISAFRFLSADYTCDVSAEPQHGVELQLRQEAVGVITSFAEKEFTYQDMLHLPQNRGAVSQVLCCRLHSEIEDAKIIGTKTVVKGRYLAEFLVKYESGSCENSRFELPFSHITDLEASQEAKLTTQLSFCDFKAEPISNDDGGGELEISIQSRIRFAVTEQKDLSLVTDLYSTAYDLAAEWQELKFWDAGETQIRRQIWQDTLEIGVPAERVLLISATCGPVSQGIGNHTELHTSLRLHALYLTEDDRILSAERSAEVVLPCPETGEQIRCTAACGDGASSVLTGDGILVRIPVDFQLIPRKNRVIRCVCAANLDETAKIDPALQPSLILKKKKREECLWDLAKCCGSTVRDILAANECVCENDIPEDRMLLIPKRRV